MNTYKIRYKSPEMEEMRTTIVTAPDQRAAEKAFNASFKQSRLPAPDIFQTELVEENTPATKDQEREALEKIKAILDTLGPDSYIGTALEGCLEIAAENIENDWACSMKQRVEAVVLENMNLKEKLKDLQEKLEKSQEVYNLALECGQALNEKVLSDDDLIDCIQMARNAAYEWGEKMEQASASIVELADDPVSPEFAQAVKDHRNAKRTKEYHEALADRLEKKQKHTAGA